MKKKLFLVEFHSWYSQIYSKKILLKALKKKTNSKIEIEAFFTNQYFFTNTFFQNFLDKIIFFLGQFFNIKFFGFYKSELKTNKIFKPNINSRHHLQSLNFYNKFSKDKITKKIIFNLKVNEIYIGDILYDSYLKCNGRATINVKDENFIAFFKNFLALFYFWKEYFKKNEVKAVLIAHNTYLTGVPARIAIYKNIKTLVDQDFKLFSLSKKNLRPQLQIKDFKTNFKKFNLDFKKKALNEANLELQKKFSGDTKNDYYLLKSAFSKKNSKNRVIKKTDNFKIIILPLSFYDSPSGYGGSLFDDFYDWLLFILKLSLKTNYDWYIKLHPDVLLKWDYLNYAVVKNLIKKFKHIKWINPEISHNQIINEGINAALTIHGTVGSEYPYFNIPVVNASKNNPHMNYNFNYHPQNIKELEKIILNLPNMKKKIDKREILEFYFMHHVLPKYNWLGIDMKAIVKKNKNIKFFNSRIDSYHLISQKVDEVEVLKSLKIFLNKENYILEKKYDKNTNYKDLYLK